MLCQIATSKRCCACLYVVNCTWSGSQRTREEKRFWVVPQVPTGRTKHNTTSDLKQQCSHSFFNNNGYLQYLHSRHSQYRCSELVCHLGLHSRISPNSATTDNAGGKKNHKSTVFFSSSLMVPEKMHSPLVSDSKQHDLCRGSAGSPLKHGRACECRYIYYNHLLTPLIINLMQPGCTAFFLCRPRVKWKRCVQKRSSALGFRSATSESH